MLFYFLALIQIESLRPYTMKLSRERDFRGEGEWGEGEWESF